MEAASPTCTSLMGDSSAFEPGEGHTPLGPCRCLVKFEVQLYKVWFLPEWCIDVGCTVLVTCGAIRRCAVRHNAQYATTCNTPQCAM